MRLAVAGKGGSGKTTIAGTLARILAGRGRSVVAIDGDSNPNLAIALGVDPSVAFSVGGMPLDLVRVVSDIEGNRSVTLTHPVSQIVEEYGVAAPDGIRLLVGARVDHAGTG